MTYAGFDNDMILSSVFSSMLSYTIWYVVIFQNWKKKGMGGIPKRIDKSDRTDGCLSK